MELCLIMGRRMPSDPLETKKGPFPGLLICMSVCSLVFVLIYRDRFKLLHVFISALI